jgi:hypothetical protein
VSVGRGVAVAAAVGVGNGGASVGAGAVVAAAAPVDSSPAGVDAGWPQLARARATRDRRIAPGSLGLALWKMLCTRVRIIDRAP